MENKLLIARDQAWIGVTLQDQQEEEHWCVGRVACLYGGGSTNLHKCVNDRTIHTHFITVVFLVLIFCYSLSEVTSGRNWVKDLWDLFVLALQHSVDLQYFKIKSLERQIQAPERRTIKKNMHTLLVTFVNFEYFIEIQDITICWCGPCIFLLLFLRCLLWFSFHLPVPTAVYASCLPNIQKEQRPEWVRARTEFIFYSFYLQSRIKNLGLLYFILSLFSPFCFLKVYDGLL